MAVTGHKTVAMVSLYAEGAKQRRRAKTAMGKMADRFTFNPIHQMPGLNS